jgi:HEXXH motif-containing protein
MIDDDFNELCEARFCAGQQELQAAMRTLVAREDADIHDALGEGPASSFLEPLLFTYFYAQEPGIGLPQIAFGHVPRSVRPGALCVRSDRAGRVVLPNLGCALTEHVNAELTAVQDPEHDELHFLLGEAEISHELSGPRMLGDTGIELLCHGNLLLDVTFTDADGRPLRHSPPATGLAHEPALLRALATLARHEPLYYALITRCVRQVFVFQCPNVNSFATLNAHGIVFLNALQRDDEIFFIDELVHQCGHVIFNAISLRRPEFVRVDPDLPMSELASERCRGEGRSLYTVLHGLFTEQAMVRCLRALDEAAVFRGRKAHELRGRLAFISRKMEIDILNMDQPGLCSELGERFLEEFRATFFATRRERDDLFRDDLSDQPYNFSYERYARLNPAAQPSDGE